jgi:DNA-binding CsgD family transcriptional regulator/energy-coupling factor transporter ATP-binding protein EcfA2
VGIHRDIHGPFIGRDDELESLTQLRRDSHRYGRFALIAGEPGIGKSRLVNEFVRRVPRGRAAIGLGRALEHVRSPFTPWISALQAVAPDAARAVHPNGQAFDDKAAMYGTVVSALRETALRRSVILVLEDLHWADAGSLDLLHVLLAEISSVRRLLVIGTVRSSEAHETVTRIFTDPQATVLELRPLPSRECIELVRSLLDSGEIAASRVQRIAALSGGNPFFASELSKSTNPGDIPLTLTSAIETRVASLQAGDVTALEAAAVLGEDFQLQLLADVLQCSTTAAAKRLESAQRAGIVLEQSEGHFRFAHALTRAVLAGHVTSAQRIDLHKRAARALERRRSFDAFGFAQLAYHHAGAHDREKAHAYRMRAGGLAYAVHAYTDAATFFGDAAACAEAGSLEQAGALARQGDALLRVPVLDEAERVYRAAIAIYRAAGMVEEAARLYQSLAHSLYNRDRVRDALSLIEHAAAQLAPLPQELNDALSLHGALYGADIDPELGLHWLNRVEEQNVRATRSGGTYYAIFCAIHAAKGDAEAFNRGVAAFHENVSVVEVDARYVGHFGNLAANALFLGLPATSLYEQCFALARTFKMEIYEAAYASHAAFERWLHGDEESFVRYGSFASANDAPIPALHSYVLMYTLLGDSSAIRDLGEVESLIAGGRNEFFGPLVGTVARRLARTGDTRNARRLLDAAAERLQYPYAAWETLTAMAEFGSTATRERAETLLQPYHDSSAPAFAATAAMVRALSAERDGDTAERDRAASRARHLYASMGWVHHERRAAELGIPQTEQRFSERELQIAQLLQQGQSNRAMAASLFISEKTVEKHLARLYEKLQVNNRAAAVRALTQLSIRE